MSTHLCDNSLIPLVKKDLARSDDDLLIVGTDGRGEVGDGLEGFEEGILEMNERVRIEVVLLERERRISSRVQQKKRFERLTL